jgi:hypothetical protein
MRHWYSRRESVLKISLIAFHLDKTIQSRLYVEVLRRCRLPRGVLMEYKEIAERDYEDFRRVPDRLPSQLLMVSRLNTY